jgi:hypothetical protein
MKGKSSPKNPGTESAGGKSPATPEKTDPVTKNAPLTSKEKIAANKKKKSRK